MPTSAMMAPPHAPAPAPLNASSPDFDSNSQSLSTPHARKLSKELVKRIGQHKYNMWFAHANMKLDGQRLEVATDSAFAARWIDSHFADQLSTAARHALGHAVEIDVRVATPGRSDNEAELNGHDEASELAGPDAPPPSVRRHGRDGRRERPRPDSGATWSDRGQAGLRRMPLLRRLEDFVVGTSNELAFSSALKLATDADGGCISPLFIHGECGVGKTHLLQGACHRFLERGGRPSHVRYVTGEQFTNEYIAAVRANTIDAFRQRIRKLDLLAIDDVHFLANKVKTQSEFLHTLDSIALSGARVVLASDAHPHQIKRFSQALISRFLSGMVVRVDRPDRAMRSELLRRIAAARGMTLSDAATQLIVSNCVGSVRELEGAITQLAAYSSVFNGHAGDSKGEIGVLLAERIFKDQASRTLQTIRVSSIIDCVCARLAVAKSDLMGSGRHRKVVLGRALVAYLSREMTTHSFPEIAQALGRNNHSTIHTADQRLRGQLDASAAVDLGGGEAKFSLRELLDQLRHSIAQAARQA